MNTADRRIAEVERYIHELAIALSALPADEREDVIAGIREHIDDSLLAIADPTPADVQRVLDELGDPLAIAGAPAPGPEAGSPPGPGPAYTNRSRASSDRAGRPDSTDVPFLQRDWIPLAVVGSFALAGLLVVLGPGPGVVAGVAWLLGLVALLASPLWRTAEKLIGVLTFVIFPGAVGLMLGYLPGWGLMTGVLSPRRFGLDPFAYGERVFSLVALVASLAVMIAVGLWLLSRGSARARR